MKDEYLLGKRRVILGERLQELKCRGGDEYSYFWEIEDADLNRGTGMCKEQEEMQLDKKSESDCAKHSEFIVIGNQAGAEFQISLIPGLMEGS